MVLNHKLLIVSALNCCIPVPQSEAATRRSAPARHYDYALPSPSIGRLGHDPRSTWYLSPKGSDCSDAVATWSLDLSPFLHQLAREVSPRSGYIANDRTEVLKCEIIEHDGGMENPEESPWSTCLHSRPWLKSSGSIETKWLGYISDLVQLGIQDSTSYAIGTKHVEVTNDGNLNDSRIHLSNL